MSNPFRTLFNISFPESKDSIPALGKVGILGFINYNPPRLPMVKGLILGGVSVPVVTIKLNDGIMLRQIGVNQEFISDQLLRFKGYANILEQFIACNLQFVRGQFLLLKVHCPEALYSFGVFHLAFCRAIFRRVLNSVGQRPPKGLTANFARKVYLVSALPCYLVVKTTEKSIRSFYPVFSQVKRCSAMGTSDHFAGFTGFVPASCRASGSFSDTRIEHSTTDSTGNLGISGPDSLAFHRAISAPAFCDSTGCLLKPKFYFANFALLCDHWHRTIVPYTVTIVKPIAVTLYLATRARLHWWSQWPGWGQTDVDAILAADNPRKKPGAGDKEDGRQLTMFGEAA